MLGFLLLDEQHWAELVFIFDKLGNKKHTHTNTRHTATCVEIISHTGIVLFEGIKINQQKQGGCKGSWMTEVLKCWKPDVSVRPAIVCSLVTG